MTVHEKAPAKINLGLCISGRRDDGYHDILSVFQTVGLCDELTVSPEGGKRLSCNLTGLSTGSDNLVLRAEEVFCSQFGISERADFTLEKRIPVGGGLGGGSSDAAAVFRALRTMYGLDVDDSGLCDIAGVLGSDIPFLVRGGTAVIGGRGEIIREAPWPFDFTYLLVYPGFGVSTAWAYENVGEYGSNRDIYTEMTGNLLNGTVDEQVFFNALYNDFEPVVFGKYPVLREIREKMLDCGARASLLTGSGSTMLGIFGEHETAVRCAGAFRDKGLDLFVTKKY